MCDQNLSYAQTPMLEPLLYTTIPARLRQHATATPEKVAFVFHSVSGDWESIGCEKLYSECLTFAKGLVHLGIEKRDTVAVGFPKSREWLVATFGTQMAGAVPLHMDFKYKDGRDILPVLQSVGNCKAIIIDRQIIETSREFIDDRIDNFKTEVNSADLPSLKYIIIHNKTIEGCMLFSEVLSFGTTFDTNLPDIDPDDIAAFLLTSGSTGDRKLVPKTHLQMMEIGRRCTYGFGIQSSDVFFNDRLFNWVAGYPTQFIVSGVTHITTRDLFALDEFKDICDCLLGIIKLERCTVSLLYHLLILEMLKTGECDIQQRIIICGGVPIPKKCSDVIGRFSEEFINGYGSTEMTPVLMKRYKKPSDYASYCVGRPYPGFEMKVVDLEGNIVQRNHTGELLIRQQATFSGYYRNNTKTSQVLNSAGWYKTDDLAYMDANGDFFVVGRCSDTILCYGEIIAPSYIEDQIREHPAVADVCVVPVSDPVCFQKVCSCVVLKTNTSLTEDELRIFISRDKIFQWPALDKSRIFLFFESFPKTPFGKIFRKGVKESAERRLNEQ